MSRPASAQRIANQATLVAEANVELQEALRVAREARAKRDGALARLEFLTAVVEVVEPE